MAKKLGKLSSRYAKALGNAVAAEGLNVQEVAEQIVAFADVWQENSSFSQAILNPMFDAKEREEALLSLAKQGGLPAVVQRFLLVLFERDRIIALPEIAEAFRVLADEIAEVVLVEVKTAKELNGEESAQVEKNLQDYIKGELKFSWQVEPELIGGMIVSYAGKVVDGSLSGKLNRLEQKISV